MLELFEKVVTRIQSMPDYIKKSALDIRNVIDEKTLPKGQLLGQKLDKLVEKMSGNKRPVPEDYLTEDYLTEDILFDDLSVESDYYDQKYKHDKEILEEKELSKETYIIDAMEKSREVDKKRLEEKIDKASDAKTKSELQQKLDAYNPEGTGKTSAKEVLIHAREKGEWLKRNDKEKRKEGFDYTQEALKQALTATKDERDKKILTEAKTQHEEQLKSEMDVLIGINKVLEGRAKQRGEEQAIINAAEGDDKALLQQDFNKRYNEGEDKKIAADEALRRAKKIAAYRAANNPKLSGQEDAIEEILTAAGRQIALTKQPDKLKKLAIISEARQKNYTERRKEKEEKEKREKEETEKYDVKVQTDKALESLNQKKKELQDAREANAGDPGMVKWYEEEIKKIDAERAKLALETRQRVEAERKDKQQQEELAEKQKRESEEEKAQQKLQEAKQRAMQKSQPQKKPESEPESESISQIEAQDENGQAKTAMRKFLDSLEPLTVPKEKKQDHLTGLYDDDDDDNDFTDSTTQETNYTTSANALRHIRSIYDMHALLTRNFDQIKKRMKDATQVQSESIVDWYRKKREVKPIKQDYPIINQLQKKIDSHFGFHATSIRELEDDAISGRAERWTVPYVIEMSSLLDKIHTSLSAYYSQLNSDEAREYIKNLMLRLHAPLFKKLGEAFLLGHKITITDQYGENLKDANGKDLEVNAYVKKNYHSSWGSRSLRGSSGSQKHSAGEYFRAALRTLKNVCIAHNKLASNASSKFRVEAAEKACDSLLSTSGLKAYNDQKVGHEAKNLLDNVLSEEAVRDIKGNGTSDAKSETADKFSDVRKLLKELKKSPVDTQDIEKMIIEINKFSIAPGNRYLYSTIYEENYESLKL